MSSMNSMQCKPDAGGLAYIVPYNTNNLIMVQVAQIMLIILFTEPPLCHYDDRNRVSFIRRS